MINYLLLLFLGLLTFHIVTRYGRRGRIVNKLPGYTAYPLVGNLLRFSVTCPNKLWELGREMSEKFYPITRVWFVSSAVVSIRHPDDIEILLTSQKAIDKGYIYDSLQTWLKTGLLTSTGDKWRNRRKILTPAFHFKILKKYLNIINEQGDKLIYNLKNQGKETIQNLMPFCSRFTLSVILESAMGISLDDMDSKSIDIYKKAIYDFGYVIIYRLPRPYIYDWMLKLPWKVGTMQTNALKVLHDFTNKVVKQRRMFHESTGNKYLENWNDLDKDDDIHMTVNKRKLPMLDLLLAAEKDKLIDDEGIKEEVDTFTFEGHDTTSVALTFALALIAENKEAQDRARSEVTELLDKSNGKLEMAELQELDYLERCIKESLRLFPPVGTILRYTAEDLQLKHGLVPADTHIILHVYDVHRDPNFWEEPTKFDPDRFLPENCENRHPFAYIPFSAGPRNCIGQKFAMLELKATLARILYDFYLEPIDRSSDIKLVADIILRPFNPVSIKFVKIDKK